MDYMIADKSYLHEFWPTIEVTSWVPGLAHRPHFLLHGLRQDLLQRTNKFVKALSNADTETDTNVFLILSYVEQNHKIHNIF